MRVTSCVTGAALAVASVSAAQLDLGPEFQVNSYTTDRQAMPAVAVHADGGFTIAYEVGDDYAAIGLDGSTIGVFLQHFDAAGARVGGQQLVNEFTRFAQTRPDVAATSGGSFVVVWDSGCYYGSGDCAPDGAAQSVGMRRFDETAAPQGPEIVVNEFTLGKQRQPAVAAAPGGEFLVVWASLSFDYPTPDRDENGVFGRRFAAVGSPAGSEFRVNAEVAYTQFAPDVASDAAGNFVVVWGEYAYLAGSYRNRVLGRRYDPTGAALGDEFVVAGDTVNAAHSPQVATADDGGFVVVWTRSDYEHDSYADVRAQRYAPDGTPEDAEFQVNTYTTDYQVSPSVAADAAGNFVVTWTSSGYHPGTSQEGDRAGIFAQPFAHDGAPLGSELLVNVFTTGSQRHAAIAGNGDGEFVVSWTSGPYYADSFPQDGSGDGVFARRLAFRSCTGSAECDDANPCTADACEGTVCLNRRQAGCCTTPAECGDGDACTLDVCMANACQHHPIVGCVACDPDTTICESPDPCTLSTCDVRTGRCRIDPIIDCCVSATECDDDAPCTEDTCSEFHRCTTTPIPECVACTADAECQTGCVLGPEACTEERCVSPAGCPLAELDDTDPLGTNGKLLARIVVPPDVPGRGRIKAVIAALAGPPDAGTSPVRRCRDGKRLGRVKAALDPGTETNLLLALDRKAQRCLTDQADGVLDVGVAIKLKRKRTMLLERTEQRIWRE